MSKTMDEVINDLNKKKEEGRPIPDYGHVYKASEFEELVVSGCLIDYDGSGSYSDGKMMYEDVCPSQVMRDGLDDRYSHVVWFNR